MVQLYPLDVHCFANAYGFFWASPLSIHAEKVILDPQAPISSVSGGHRLALNQYKPTMKRRKRKPKWSSKSTRSALDRQLSNAEAYLDQEQLGLALDVLEQVPARYHSDSEFRYLRGRVRMMVGEFHRAIDDFEYALKNERAGSSRFIQLAMAYMLLSWPRHAWHYCERFLQRPEQQDMIKPALALMADAKSIVVEEADTLEVPFDRLAKALIPHERAQFHLALAEPPTPGASAVRRSACCPIGPRPVITRHWRSFYWRCATGNPA